jgi:hypothetical protein
MSVKSSDSIYCCASAHGVSPDRTAQARRLCYNSSKLMTQTSSEWAIEKSEYCIISPLFPYSLLPTPYSLLPFLFLNHSVIPSAKVRAIFFWSWGSTICSNSLGLLIKPNSNSTDGELVGRVSAKLFQKTP